MDVVCLVMNAWSEEIDFPSKIVETSLFGESLVQGLMGFPERTTRRLSRRH